MEPEWLEDSGWSKLEDGTVETEGDWAVVEGREDLDWIDEEEGEKEEEDGWGKGKWESAGVDGLEFRRRLVLELELALAVESMLKLEKGKVRRKIQTESLSLSKKVSVRKSRG